MASLRQRRITLACMLSDNLDNAFCASLLNAGEITSSPLASSPPAMHPPTTPFQDTDPREQEQGPLPQDTPTFEQVKGSGVARGREVGGVARQISGEFELCPAAELFPPKADSSKQRSDTAELSLNDSLRGFSSQEFFHFRRYSSAEKTNVREELSFLQRREGVCERGQAERGSPTETPEPKPFSPAHSRRNSSPKPGQPLPAASRRSSHASIKHFDIDQTTHLRRYPQPKTSLI